MPPIYIRGPLRAPEGEGGAGGGGAPSDDKKFNQADLDRIAAQVRRETEKKFDGFDELKKKASQVDELSTQVSKLQEDLELKGKHAADQEKILAERARKQSEKELEALKSQVGELTVARDGANTRLRMFQVETALGTALHSAGVLQSAHSDALNSLMRTSEIELDDKGTISSVKFDGVPQKDLASAAAAFLSAKPHFKAAKPGGGGTTTPNGGTPTGERLQSLSPEEALAAGLRAQPPPRPGDDRWEQNQH
jgi:hypothetical protein